ncbi:MAG: hypothetical protein K6B12_05070 [Clostridiales bacterium]|nr:hypothetical protein [Clostridiales bacterium]
MNDTCTVQIYTADGTFSSGQLALLAQLAVRYGNGTVRPNNSRLVSMPSVKTVDLEALQESLAAEGLRTALLAQDFKPVVFCRGLGCRHGQIDTISLAAKIEERFLAAYETGLPHKFRIAVCGCINNCAKADLCDVGIVGWQHGYKVFLGGQWGKKHSAGKEAAVLQCEEEVLALIGRALDLYQKEGKPRERFGDMLGRLGSGAFGTLTADGASQGVNAAGGEEK